MQTQIIKNISFSIAWLLISRQLTRFISNRFGHKYPNFSTYILPLGSIYGLYNSTFYLNLATSFPGLGFLQFLLRSYAQVYMVSYGMSFITFIVGYPTIHILMNMLNNYSKRSRLLNDNEDSIKEFSKVCLKMLEALQNNQNCDFSYHGFSFRTWTVQKPFVSQEELDATAPLRSAENPSGSEYLETCNICLETLDSKKLHRELPCLHVFHPECVDSWLLRCNACCPMCRANVCKRETTAIEALD